MTIRDFNLQTDYADVCRWWEGHGAAKVPDFVFLPAIGLIAEGIAVAWLFVAQETQDGIGVIEFTTTNPEAPGKAKKQALEGIMSQLEQIARDRGCASAMAFVGVNSGEKRLMERCGYADMRGEPHLIYGKSLWPSPS